MLALEKYNRNREGLQTFLTSINLYCGYYKVPNNKEKILIAHTYIKWKAAI